nr:D-glucuronyl C5-epimerase family protein [uncultured Blautia sp.]
MSINIQKIKKWSNMLMGKSVYHVNQDAGKIYSKSSIKGYYNNLTEKITRFGYNDDRVPTTIVDSGAEIYFSIAIFQYGLGAYDLFLLNGDKSMLDKTLACANWAIENQQQNGSWVTFEYENKEHPYSSMAQGEGISLLCRAYLATSNFEYKEAIEKAFSFMILPIEKGGTTKYENDEVFLYECTNDPLILNGWIFSIWGIWDYCKLIENPNAKNILDRTLTTLEKKIPEFDIGYWSMYEDGKRICSPFYHNLHIEQLKVMYDLTGKDIYKIYSEKWENYQNNKWNCRRAFIKKALQKIFE